MTRRISPEYVDEVAAFFEREQASLVRYAILLSEEAAVAERVVERMTGRRAGERAWRHGCCLNGAGLRVRVVGQQGSGGEQVGRPPGAAAGDRGALQRTLIGSPGVSSGGGWGGRTGGRWVRPPIAVALLPAPQEMREELRRQGARPAAGRTLHGGGRVRTSGRTDAPQGGRGGGAACGNPLCGWCRGDRTECNVPDERSLKASRTGHIPFPVSVPRGPARSQALFLAGPDVEWRQP